MGVLRHPTRLRSFREVVAFSCALAAATTTTKKKKGGERSLLYRTRSTTTTTTTTTFPRKQKTNISRVKSAYFFESIFHIRFLFSLGRDNDQTKTHSFPGQNSFWILPHKKISARRSLSSCRHRRRLVVVVVVAPAVLSFEIL